MLTERRAGIRVAGNNPTDGEGEEGVGLDHQATHRAERAPLLVERGLGGAARAGLDH